MIKKHAYSFYCEIQMRASLLSIQQSGNGKKIALLCPDINLSIITLNMLVGFKSAGRIFFFFFLPLKHAISPYFQTLCQAKMLLAINKYPPSYSYPVPSLSWLS